MDKRLAETVGSAVREARTKQGWSQADAAERLGVSLEFYGKLERAESLPSVETLTKLVDVLEVDANTLLGRTRKIGGKVFRVNPSPPPPPIGPPELARLVRRLRSAKPATLRALVQIVNLIEAQEEEPSSKPTRKQRPTARRRPPAGRRAKGLWFIA